MYFTDNRYTDDCHYKGGALQMLYDVGTYGLAMVGRNLLPPRPDLAGERWADDLGGAPAATSPGCCAGWRTRPTTSSGARARSCEDYGAITCADLPDRRLARRLHQLQPADLRSTCAARRSC